MRSAEEHAHYRVGGSFGGNLAKDLIPFWATSVGAGDELRAGFHVDFLGASDVAVELELSTVGERFEFGA